jgi:hypothetical protein
VSIGHGRRARRTVKVALAPAWIEFAGAAPVAQVRRTVTRKGKKTAEAAYLITSDRMAGPAALAAWNRGNLGNREQAPLGRDVTYQEDKSLVRTGNAPRVMATLRSLAISLLRLDGHTNIARRQPPLRPRPAAHAQAASDRINDFAGSLPARQVAEAVTADGPSRSFSQPCSATRQMKNTQLCGCLGGGPGRTRAAGLPL